MAAHSLSSPFPSFRHGRKQPIQGCSFWWHKSCHTKHQCLIFSHQMKKKHSLTQTAKYIRKKQPNNQIFITRCFNIYKKHRLAFALKALSYLTEYRTTREFRMSLVRRIPSNAKDHPSCYRPSSPLLQRHLYLFRCISTFNTEAVLGWIHNYPEKNNQLYSV